jgi:D-beta-D-heptose 7-phosphate kinase/D-beta-D-heptose 1-phosphate adenosyltransferase
MNLDSAVKIRTRADAIRWRALRNGIVVFTNGVFDIVHRGHVTLLEAARREGDFLVVGINSDASVHQLNKGPGRPFVAEQDRARVVAAFEAVDCVVIFEETTPFALIQSLEPDVLVKGSDYSMANTIGADIVQARGGRVKHVELAAGFSTTAIVERLREPS